jgi:polysaccharide pyruvyl transferase WcaK-like protein
MKILIENSGYQLQNMGDVAMLQVAVQRFQRLFPTAEIQVLTLSPTRLERYCPGTMPLAPKGRLIWGESLGRSIQRLSNHPTICNQALVVEHWLHRYAPNLLHGYMKAKFWHRDDLRDAVDEYIDAMEQADLVVATGGGYLTDDFDAHANVVLSHLRLAIAKCKPTVMLGHGIGPLKQPQLRTKAQAILPSVNLITLRESRSGTALLQDLGVPSDRVVTTGDDAIELAYNQRPAALGQAIGVNLRLSKYSNVAAATVETVRLAIQSAAQQLGVELLPVPIVQAIDQDKSYSDCASIQTLLAGWDSPCDGGTDLTTPKKVIQQVGRCRVVVTGSYHAGVFALSQGIPIVGIAQSQYYVDKFLGLADQFTTGCQVVVLEPHLTYQQVAEIIQAAWFQAETVRPHLLAKAQEQIDRGQCVYQRLLQMV